VKDSTRCALVALKAGNVEKAKEVGRKLSKGLSKIRERVGRERTVAVLIKGENLNIRNKSGKTPRPELPSG